MSNNHAPQAAGPAERGRAQQVEPQQLASWLAPGGARRLRYSRGAYAQPGRPSWGAVIASVVSWVGGGTRQADRAS
eukprot:COSAG05_NODE_2342_length_3204_cov_5.613205_1_plen_76_part_00